MLAQARRWLSGTERIDAISESPPTPKTIFQLAAAIKQHSATEYLPFGCDFEDSDAYSPTISRLLLYAEIHNYKDHEYGTFSTPRQEMPYTYGQLQEWIFERRRRQASDATEHTPHQRVTSAEDLSTKLVEFASDAIVVKHLIEFALPSKKRTNATQVTLKATSTASANGSKSRSAATDHTICTDEMEGVGGDAQQLHINVLVATSEATEHATNQKKRLKKYDDSHRTDSYDVTLSQATAKAMADDFFKFIQQESRLGFLIYSRVTLDRRSH